MVAGITISVKPWALRAAANMIRFNNIMTTIPTSSLKRFGAITAGFTVIMVGVALLVLPGPGLVLIAAGLTILGRHFHWAHRLMEPVRRRIEELRKKSSR
jgi:hypothetical protein